MSNLRTAAQQALEALDAYSWEQVDAARTALKAALADGDNLSPTEPFSPDWDRIQPLQENLREHMAEIKRLRAALAKPTTEDSSEVEPVASIYITPNGAREFDDWRHDLPVGSNLLYTAPPQRPAEPVQEPDVPETNFGNMEPVAWLWQHRETGRTRVLMPDERTATDVAAAWDVVGPLYLAPPQRKPLNEFDALRLVTESIGRLQSAGPVEGLIGIVRAVEAKHGIT